MRLKIRKGDTVKVLRGRDGGKTGTVIRAIPAKARIVVEGINMVQKHVRAKRTGEKGQRLSVAAALSISNVQLICPQCKRATRVGITRLDGKRQRVCKKCNSVIE